MSNWKQIALALLDDLQQAIAAEVRATPFDWEGFEHAVTNAWNAATPAQRDEWTRRAAEFDQLLDEENGAGRESG